MAHAFLLTPLCPGMRDGAALLLVDGLDEIGDVDTRRDFAEKLAHLANAYPAARILLTSRTFAYYDVGAVLGETFQVRNSPRLDTG